MNTFVAAMDQNANETVTLNGMDVLKSSMSSVVDLFFAIGASRSSPENILPLFQKAAKENLDLAVRTALYARDVRGGMGERAVFRLILNDFAHQDPANAERLVALVPELGRWDDLFAFVGTAVEDQAVSFYANALRDGNALAAKWAPREKSSKKDWASRLRHALGMTPRNYRKFLALQSEGVVEQKMASNRWNDINYEQVPSLASARYQTAFMRHDPVRYQEYLNSLDKGEAKINAGAVYPYDVTKSLRRGEKQAAEAQWKSLPDYIQEDVSFLPLVDTSGSMTRPISGGTETSCMDVSVSLGLYCAQRNRSAFKNKLITFSRDPEWIDVDGLSLDKAVGRVNHANWGFNTNITKAYRMILHVARKNDVVAEDMPSVLIIFSDMQFDQSTSGTIDKSIRKDYERAGYQAPTLVFWNLADYGRNTPVEFNKDGVMLVSGFSPALMKSVLAADLEDVSPEKIVVDTVGVDRYNW